MPTNFERVKQVLDILCPPLGTEAGPLVKSAISGLSGSYNGLASPVAGPVDYSSSHAQAGYIYEYVPAHADLVYSTLKDAAKEASLFLDAGSVTMLCAGGGPGTELLGLFKFIERQTSKQVDVRCYVWDKNTPWTAAVDAVRSTSPANVKVKTGFENFDWCSTNPWTPENFETIDILTLSYTLSEVWRYNGNNCVENNIEIIISALKPGCLIIYSDNSGESFDPYFEEHVLSRGDVKLIDRTDYDHMLIGGDEQASVLAGYREWMGAGAPMSKLTGKATCAALVKL